MLRRWFTLTALLVGVSFELPAATTIDPTYQPSGDASFNGTFNWSYPLVVPQGTNGLTPNLSIAYNSAFGGGTLGSGFYLSGFTRIAPNPDYPGTYTLDGQRLYKDSHNNFHTQHETYDLIQAFDSATGSQTGSPSTTKSYWVISKKDGTKLIYGNTDQSRGIYPDRTVQGHFLPGNSVAVAWPICQVIDPYGNYEQFDYSTLITVNSNTGEQVTIVMPYSVAYTRNNGSRKDGNGVPVPDMSKWKLVKLGYDMLVKTYSFKDPYNNTFTTCGLRPQLTHIDVFCDVDNSGMSLQRSYYLGYSDSSTPGKFCLSSIQEFGNDAVYTSIAPPGSSTPTPPPSGTAVPKTTFDWTSDWSYLQTVHLPQGGALTAGYSTTSVGGQSFSVLGSLSTSDGLTGGSSDVETFGYSGGAFLSGYSQSQTNVGFATVTKQSSTSKASWSTTYSQTPARWGLVTETKVTDGSLSPASLMSDTTTTFEDRAVDPSIPDVNFTYPRQQTTAQFDGLPTGMSHRKVYTYDFDKSATNSVGNMVGMDDYGVTKADGTEDPRNHLQELYTVTPSSASGAYLYRLTTKKVYQSDAYNNLSLAAGTYYHFDGLSTRDAVGSLGQLSAVETLISSTSGTETTATTTYTYDNYGNRLSTVDASSHIAQSATFDSIYHAMIDSVTSSDGLSTTLGSRDHLLPQTSTDSGGNTTSTKYDAFGRVLWVVSPEAQASGSTTLRDSVSSPSETLEYDTKNASTPQFSVRKVKISANNGSPVYLATYSYVDGLGREIQTKSQQNSASGQYVTVDKYYDGLGRLTGVSIPYLSFSFGFTYDVTRFYDPNQKKTTSNYDALGRLIKVNNPDGSTKFTAYSQATTTQVDENNHKVTIEDRGCLKTTTYYKGTYPNGGLTVDNTKTVFTSPGKVQYLEDGIEIDFDLAGRKTSWRDNNGSFSYAYYPNGQLKSQSFGFGPISFDYDSKGRLSHKYAGDFDNGTLKLAASYLYGDSTGKTGLAAGMLSTISLADGSYTLAYDYDSLGRLVGLTKTVGPQYGTRSERWGYDSDGRQAWEQFPSGETVWKHYADGKLDQLSGNSNYLASVNFDGFGRIANQTLGNSSVISYTFDPTSARLTDLVTPGVESLHFEYDPVGNITKRTDNLDSTSSEIYDYDYANRLLDATGKYGNRSFVYDKYNNLVGPNGTAAYTASFQKITSGGGKDYAYDIEGNLVAKMPLGLNWYQKRVVQQIAGTNSPIPGDYDYSGVGFNTWWGWVWIIQPDHEATATDAQILATTVYRYDSEGRLTEVDNGRQIAAKYKYGDSRQRVTMTTGAMTTVFWFDDYEEGFAGSSPLAATASYYAEGHKIAQRMPANASGGLYYVFQDQLGSTSKIAGSLGGGVNSTNYEPFGKVCGAPSSTVRESFTGQELDINSGLEYYNARFYDPALGRFIQPDTVMDGLNRYTYCGNNPVNRVDPSGNNWDWLAPVKWLYNGVNYVYQKVTDAMEEEHLSVPMAMGFSTSGAFVQFGDAEAFEYSYNLTQLSTPASSIKAVDIQVGDEMKAKTFIDWIAPRGSLYSQYGGNDFLMTVIWMAATRGFGEPPAPGLLTLGGTLSFSSVVGRAAVSWIDIASFMGGRDFREKTTGANANDRKQVDSVAKKLGLDRNDFGKFVEDTKFDEGRGGSDNYTYKELLELGKAFLEQTR
jgi:RHS repeat-associated protein